MGRWITKNGHHIYLPDENEIDEQEKKKDREIKANKKEADKLNRDYNKHDIKIDGGILRYSVQKMEPDVIYVHGLEVPKNKRNKGIGTKLLNTVKQMSDDSGLNAELFAIPIKDATMNVDELVDWYEKRGFEHQGGNVMKYFPKTSKKLK